MMKKLLFTFVMLCVSGLCFSQGTYYWVGGSTATTLAGTTWATTPGGTAVSRNNINDVLVFDNATVAFTLTSAEIAKLVVQNNSDISLERSASGSSTLTINGTQGGGLTIENSKLTLKGGSGINFILKMASPATGTVSNSQLTITGAGANRIEVPTAGSLVFSSGSVCNVSVSGTNPFSVTDATLKGIVFNTGTTLTYQGGSKNPFGSSSTSYAVDMQSGSNFIVEAAPVSGTFTSKFLGNVTIRNNTSVSLAENFNNIDNLTIETGSTFLIRSTGVSPVSGNIVNNGTFGAAATTGTSQLLMKGIAPQTISGSGTFNELGALSIATDADVTLQHSLSVAGTGASVVTGKLNFGTYTITGTGIAANTGRFSFREAASNSTTAATVVSGSNIITISGAENYTALSPTIGLLVSGPQIPANSYIIATNSAGGTFTISNNAIGNGTSISVIGNAPTLITSNSAGVDGSISINTNGTLSFGAGTNLVFNAATNSPFSLKTSNDAGNITFNAAATTNKTAGFIGKLTLNNAMLTVRSGDTLKVASTGSFAGTYGQSAYIATEANTSTGVTGVVKVEGITSQTLIPVGTSAYYAPLTLTPSEASNYSVNVFDNITADATPNGIALSNEDKKNLINAIWNINRSAGTGTATVALGWQSAMEGSDFSSLPNNQIGIAQYASGAYTTYAGSGDNAANMATTTLSSFGPLSVGKLTGVLPVKVISFSAKANFAEVNLKWQASSELNLSHYIVQQSSDNKTFANVATVAAQNVSGILNYSATNQAATGTNYYRLLSVDKDGTTVIAALPIAVQVGAVNAVSAYPNPVSSGVLTVSGLAAGDILRLSDINGKVLLTDTSKGNAAVLNVQNLTVGTYILSVKGAAKANFVSRIIKL